MEPIATFSGLASGVQWRDMIDQLMQVESRPAVLLQNRITDLQTESAAWLTFRTRVDGLRSAASKLSDPAELRAFETSLRGFTTASAPFSASAGTTAAEGTVRVAVHRLAAREKLGGVGVAARDEALGLAGELRINGARVEVEADDSLDAIASRLSQAGGTADRGFSASVVSTSDGGFRLVLTADDTGAEGLDLVDGTSGVLRELGFLATETALKHGTSDGARSDALAAGTEVLADLLGLQSPPPAGDVQIGALTVNLDLSTMSLEDVATAISDAAALAGSPITAEVVSETAPDGTATHRLDVSGTTSFVDGGGILEAMGVLEGLRTATQRSLQSSRTLGDASTGLAATGSTRLDQLQVDGVGAGVQVGDTLTIQGTRGDGSAVELTWTVQAGDTLDDLTAFLNSGTGAFGEGRAASAAISADGRLVVTDGTGGSSLLGLSIVAHNEGGGSLDLGGFEVVEEGRTREIAAGTDALVEVDGSFLTHGTNRLEGVVEGLTLELSAATGEAVDVELARDTSDTVKAVKAFVDAYNAMQEFVGGQFSGAGANGENPPLSGNSTLRRMRGNLAAAMRAELLPGVAGELGRLAHVGITVTREGTYELDTAALEAALDEDPDAVGRLFGDHVTGSSPDLRGLTWDDATVPGAWDVEITRAAARAELLGTGFGGGLGTYQDDGVADTLTVTDVASGSAYAVELANGATAQEIVDALNAAFGTATTRRLEATGTFHADAGGASADASTLLADLHASDGSAMGVAAGDVLTLSGTDAAGSTFLVDVEVEDPAAMTLGDLVSRIQDAVGADVQVDLDAGRLVLEAPEPGASAFTLSLTSDNAGGGSFGVGSVDVVEAGRGIASLQGFVEGGEIGIRHDAYGSAEGFEIDFVAGGADGTGSLGLAPGQAVGVDVAGTLGGQAAQGTGRVLEGAAGTSAQGLMISYGGSDTGSVGSVTFSRGIASQVALAAAPMLEAGAGSIDDVTEGLEGQVLRLEDRIEDFNARLEEKRARMIRTFTAMEEAMARAQSQMQWLAGQIDQLTPRDS